jgi:hypothetical protein
MKTFYQIIVVALAGLLTVACTDVGSAYGDSSWYGEYETRFVDGEVSVPTFMTTSILLTFSEDGQECCALYGSKGIDGMMCYDNYDYLGASQSKYVVLWSSWNSFTLSIPLVGQLDGSMEQAIVVYAGKISGRKMKLDLISCDRVEKTIELKKTDYL